MPRKANVEDGIVEWFQSAPMEKAQMMVAVVGGIVKRRQQGGPSQPTVSKRKPKVERAEPVVEGERS